jgi:type IV secretion system protein VirB6
MPDITLFSFIGGTVTNATSAFVTPAASNLMYPLQMIAIAGVTLHFVLLGYQIIAGAIQGTLVSVVKQSMKVMFVAAFALSADGYQTHVLDTLNGLETVLTDVLSATVTGSPASTNSIYTTLDQVLNEGFLLATACLEQGSEAGWNLAAALGWFSSALLIALGTLVFALLGA